MYTYPPHPHSAKPYTRSAYLNPNHPRRIELTKNPRLVKRELEDAGFDERSTHNKQTSKKKKKGDEDKVRYHDIR